MSYNANMAKWKKNIERNETVQCKKHQNFWSKMIPQITIISLIRQYQAIGKEGKDKKLRRIKMLLKTKLNRGNQIKEMNNCMNL